MKLTRFFQNPVAAKLAFSIQLFASCIVSLSVAATAIAAEDSETSSQKVRNAINILKSSAEPAQKAITDRVSLARDSG